MGSGKALLKRRLVLWFFTAGMALYYFVIVAMDLNNPVFKVPTSIDQILKVVGTGSIIDIALVAMSVGLLLTNKLVKRKLKRFLARIKCAGFQKLLGYKE